MPGVKQQRTKELTLTTSTSTTGRTEIGRYTRIINTSGGSITVTLHESQSMSGTTYALEDASTIVIAAGKSKAVPELAVAVRFLVMTIGSGTATVIVETAD